MQKSKYFKSKKYFYKKEHGGSLAVRKRKSKRNLPIKKSFHVTLRSDFATGKRSLLRHKNFIYKVLNKSGRRFDVKIYNEAICGNHIHLLIRGRNRTGLQNFFRVVAGHIAQQIVKEFPILEKEQKLIKKLRKLKWGNALVSGKKLSYERKFWDTLIYSRLVAWGKDFKNVVNYIEMNLLEAEGMIPYQQRKMRFVEMQI